MSNIEEDIKWYEGQALAAWIQALAMRFKEPGYSDAAVASEAVRLAKITAAMIAKKEAQPHG